MELTVKQLQEREASRSETLTVTEVKDAGDSWSISSTYTGFYIRKKYGEPKPGDTITLYPGGLGSELWGADLNGEPMFFRTAAMREALKLEADEKRRQKMKEELDEHREEYESTLAAMPEVIQRRIAWFREHSEEFDLKYLSYELMACKDAVAVAAIARKATEDPGVISADEWLTGFAKMSFDTQREVVSALDEGHSSNSFGFVLKMARHLVTDERMAFFEHGAMTPLVGCEAYGCAHPRPGIEEFMEERRGEQDGDKAH